MKKYIFIISLIILSFGFYKVSFAYTISQQTINDTLSGTADTQYSQFLYPLNGGSPNSVDLYLKSSAGTSSVYADILCSTTFPAFTACSENPITALSAEQIITTTKTKYTFNWATSSASFSNTKYYQIRISKASGNNFNIYGQTGATSTPNLWCYDPTKCGTVTAMYYVLNGSVGSTTVSWLYPTDGLQTRRFENWIIQAGGTFTKIGVRSKIASSTSWTNDDYIYPYSTINTENISIPRSPLAIGTIATSAIMYAQLYYLDQNNIETALPQITINLGFDYPDNNNPYAGYANQLDPNTPYGNSSSSLQNCSITNVGGCFINAGTFLINYFFIPPAPILDTVKEAVLQIKTVYPFKTAFDFASTTNSALITPAQQDFNLPMPWATSTTVSLLSSTTLSSKIGDSNTTLWKTTIGYFLWLTGVMFTFKILI